MLSNRVQGRGYSHEARGRSRVMRVREGKITDFVESVLIRGTGRKVA